MCSECKASPPIFNGMRSWAVYSESIRESIHSLKYKNNIPLGYYFSKKLIPLIAIANWSFDLVVPVPLNRSHYRDRGYNQSSLIARPLAHSLGLPFNDSALERIRETSPQFSLSAEERILNVKDAFRGNPANIKGKGVLIIDDVITTGATMENCTKALVESGATRVYCLSVARVIV
jgi:competence protein ComFC